MNEKKLVPIAGPGMIQGRAPYTFYLDELRAEYGSTVYAIDRYVEVFKIRDNVWAMNAPCTHAVGDNWIYLIEGPEKGLTIDNGYGVGNLKGLCEMLCGGKEVLTAVTHNHGDHAGGSPQWDKVYCHDYCADMLEQKMPDYNAEWNRFNHVGEPQWRHYYKDEDIVPYNGFACVHMQDHDIINLGEDYDIEILHVGGHAPGEACFLDKKGRILYTGDAVFESRVPGLGLGLHGKGEGPKGKPEPLHSECQSIHFFARKIKEMAARVNEWDYCMAGHGYFDSPASLITDMAECAQAVLDDPHKYTNTVETRFGIGYLMERGLVNIRYTNPDTILNQ